MLTCPWAPVVAAAGGSGWRAAGVMRDDVLTVVDAACLVCSILISVDYVFAVCSTNKLSTNSYQLPTNFIYWDTQFAIL